MKKDVKELIDLASNDLKIAKELYNKKHFLYSCFFAQQSAEKVLKAYLLHKNNEYPFIHSIVRLIKMCEQISSDFKELYKLKVETLTKYYTGSRYLPLLRISQHEAKEAIDIAEKVNELVIKLIKEKDE